MSVEKKNIMRLFGVKAVLSAVFLSSAAMAQDSVLDFRSAEQPDEVTQQDGDPKEVYLRSLLPNLSMHPMAGGTVNLTVCGDDGLGHTACDSVSVELPMPKLNNPIGYEVQALRRQLAIAIEETARDADGMPVSSDLKKALGDLVVSFESFLDKHAIEFQRVDTLLRVMNLHYDVLQHGEAEPDLEELDMLLNDFQQIMLRLEDDLLTDAERAFRDAEKAFKEALERGASEEELKELSEQMGEALDAFIEEKLESDEGLSPSEMKALEDMQKFMEEMKKLMEELGITPEMYAEMMQEMMKNMKDDPPGPPQQGGDQEVSIEEMLKQMKKQLEMMKKMFKYMKDINDIIEKQEILRDQSMSTQLDILDGKAPPSVSQGFENRQDNLENRLNALIRGMKKDDLDTRAFESAEDEMEDAEEDLGDKQYGDAVVDMDEALELLRMAEQSMQSAMMGMGMPGQPGNKSGNSGDSQANLQNGTGSLIDQDGKLRGSENSNTSIGISPSEDTKESRAIRNRILNRQQQSGGGQNGYLNDLLDNGLDGGP